MMGRQSAQEQLFHSFRLEDHIPGDHLLRQLDLVLNFDRVRSVLSGHYSSTGRPSIDPELMLRILLVGYVYGIRSERQLCGEVHLNLAYRSGLGIIASSGWRTYHNFVTGFLRREE
jgi:transposase